ncbi:tyrosine/phenylalanine carboxypeptidase domain-containing protein [Alkalisalibacterium limincola]|uniref:tyrosine/phenylalanine carboxypeptidase domain-containing protein n=1 Tax=Alkalisalibacterium limincola TaxID=2699169 RepID=UPI001650AE59|nr:tyrosine/phenylalanine carboxypeptidase domain-containing protein [Alkalisalibacterium limincola]
MEGFTSDVVVADDLNSLLMVSRGRLYIAEDIRVARSRVDPLIQHEIGTHVVTHHNGSQQPLTQLASGLAHYDALQEGLGVLAEYLAGYLPAERMRVIAGRVIAADMMLHGTTFADVFACLDDEYQLDTHDAFDVTVRAFRGGGLTKDAVYLAGLSDILDYLSEGEPFEDLFIGKFALSQMDTLRELAGQGWVHPPDVMPRYLENPAAIKRLERCRQMPLDQLFHREPHA